MTAIRWIWLAALPLFLLSAEVARGEPLTRVEAKRVCMVNNTVFSRDQIPVEVAGKTYFGCCAMCKDRLTRDASAREASDPVTGKKVDKATAVIGATTDGKVYYFESEESLARFSGGA